MTKKDYYIIIESIVQARTDARSKLNNGYCDLENYHAYLIGIDFMVEAIIDRLGLDNEKFNEKRFRTEVYK